MNENRIEKLRKLREEYIRLLGNTFHHKDSEELAELSLNPKYKKIIEDYIGFCFPEFRIEYETARKSKLEQRAQTSPKCISFRNLINIRRMEPNILSFKL